MNKSKRHINMLDMSRITNYKSRADKVKTTNINILLNKVRYNKKKDFKKKIIYTSLLISIIGLLVIFVTI